MRKPLAANTAPLFGLVVLLVTGLTMTAPSYALAFYVTLPDGSQQITRTLRPGESATLVFSVENLDVEAGVADPGGWYVGDAIPQAEYVIDSGTPARCGAMTSTPPAYASAGRLRFSVGPLDVGESITCTYRVTRALGSINDLKLSFCPNMFLGLNCLLIPIGDYLAGTLPDLALRSTQVGYLPTGAAEGKLRITGTNLSDRDVAEQNIATDCTEFGFGVFNPSPFEIDNNFPGACPSGSYARLCFNFTGMNFSSRNFLVGPIPAHGEASCDLHLRFRHPLTGPLSLGIGYYLYGDFVQFADGGIGFDTNTANSMTTLTAAPGAPYVAATVPTASRIGLLVLALLLIAGVTRYARHVKTPGNRCND